MVCGKGGREGRNNSWATCGTAPPKYAFEPQNKAKFVQDGWGSRQAPGRLRTEHPDTLDRVWQWRQPVRGNGVNLGVYH